MSKPLAASKKLMQSYLSELLTEEEVEPKLAPLDKEKPALPVKEKQIQPLEKLLNSATFPKVAAPEVTKQLSSAKANNKSLNQNALVDKKVTTAVAVNPITAKVTSKSLPLAPVLNPDETNINDIKTHKSSGGFTQSKALSYRQGDFQAMFFDVAGLIIAVPLVELGGIHSSHKTTPLMGKPDWFKGVMLHRDEKISVVDTALWVMPEKCNEALISALNYQYIIMLSNSAWGLSAEKLVDTVTLKQEDVKWLDTPNKRPWLAGLVKNRMCALLDVESLIKLLEKGANIKQD